MLRNIFSKTLFEQRFALLSWYLGIFLIVFSVGMMFPSIHDMFGSQMSQIPKAFQGWFGENANLMGTFSGFTVTELVGNVGIMLVIMTIIFGSSFIAGDEEKNILQPLLTLPISRKAIYFQKWLALSLINLIAVFVWGVAVICSAMLVDEHLTFIVLVRTASMFFLTNLTLGTLALSFGALSGKRSIGGIFIGVYTFLSYFINALAAQSDIVEKLNYLSIFKYANYISLADTAIEIQNVSVIFAILLISFCLGYVIFYRRDIQMN